METKSYLKTWSEKLPFSLEEIEKEFSKTLEKEKIENSNLSQEELEKRTLKLLHIKYKNMLRSPAIAFEGIIIGSTQPIDVVAKRRREAKELYRADPQTAISQGITNEEGEPLDTKKQWASGKENPQFGKPLPQTSFLRNVYGIAVRKNNSNDVPKFFSMVLNGDKAENLELPLFKPVRFMAVDRTKDEDSELSLNQSILTQFEVDNNLEFGNIQDIVSSVCKDKLISISELGNYHNTEKDNFNRLSITIGDVSQVNLEPTQFGSRIMTIEDLDNLEDLEATGITCWIPEEIEVDFLEGSKVIVVGKTNQGRLKDEDGNLTEELGQVNINVCGLYAIPEFKVQLHKIPEEFQNLDTIED